MQQTMPEKPNHALQMTKNAPQTVPEHPKSMERKQRHDSDKQQSNRQRSSLSITES